MASSAYCCLCRCCAGDGGISIRGLQHDILLPVTDVGLVEAFWWPRRLELPRLLLDPQVPIEHPLKGNGPISRAVELNTADDPHVPCLLRGIVQKGTEDFKETVAATF